MTIHFSSGLILTEGVTGASAISTISFGGTIYGTRVDSFSCDETFKGKRNNNKTRESKIFFRRNIIIIPP